MVPWSDADGSLVELLLEVGDEVVILLDLFLALLDLSFEIVDFPVFILGVEFGLIKEFLLGLKLSLDVKYLILFFVDVSLLLFDDVILLLIFLFFLVVLFPIVLNHLLKFLDLGLEGLYFGLLFLDLFFVLFAFDL